MTEPPFSGSIEFKLTIRAFDKQVIRKALVNYTYTPTWPYYDVSLARNGTAMPNSSSASRCWPYPGPTGTVQFRHLPKSHTGSRLDNF